MPYFISLNIASDEATWNYSWGGKITQLNSFVYYGCFVGQHAHEDFFSFSHLTFIIILIHWEKLPRRKSLN